MRRGAGSDATNISAFGSARLQPISSYVLYAKDAKAQRSIITVRKGITRASRRCRRWKLEQELQQGKLTEPERREVVDMLEARERDFTRLQRQRMSAADFEPLTLIGRGAFGEVLALQ